MKQIYSILLPVFIFVQVAYSQSVVFPDDSKQRGYYDRPYKRYEVEPGKCVSNGLFLSPAFVQTEIQSEASNGIALQLLSGNDYVEWKNDEAADGLVIRFSIPDGKEGRGMKGNIALFVNGKFVQDIILDSYWAWQYAALAGEQTYPDNEPSPDKFARMRFDEVRIKLDKKIPKGTAFRLVKTDDNNIPYTIDFAELEPVPAKVTFESLPGANKVQYSKADGPLDAFVAANGGKTIYIPEGVYNVAERIVIHEPDTKIIGAGMWYTELFFSAPPPIMRRHTLKGVFRPTRIILYWTACLSIYPMTGDILSCPAEGTAWLEKDSWEHSGIIRSLKMFGLSILNAAAGWTVPQT